MKKIFYLLLVTIQSQIGWSQTLGGLDWITKSNPEHTVTFPKNWKFDDSGDMGALFTIYSPFTDEEDNYNEYVQLNVLPVNGLNITLDSHVQSVLKDVPFFYQKSEVTLNRKDKKANREFAVLAYNGYFNDFALSHYQYIWLVDERVYTLSFSGQPEGVKLLLPEAIKIMDSFNLIR